MVGDLMTSAVSAASVPGQDYGHALEIPGGEINGGEVFTRDHTGTWTDAIDNWTTSLTAANYSALTIRQRRWQLRKLCEAHLRTSPFKLSTDDLHAWLAEQNWGSETRKSAVGALRSFYGWAVEQRRMKHSPAAGLKSRPVPRRFPRPASDAVWERVMASGPNDRLRLMLLLAGYCGLRVGEIAKLRWADIDDEWMIVRGKGSKERRVPLVSSVSAELADEYSRRLKGRVGSGFRSDAGDIATWVFPGKHGGMDPSWVSELLSNALGPGTTGHMLRHRAATRALDGEGVNLAAVQELLGHVNPQTTRIYSRVSDAALRKAAEAI